MLVSSPKVSIVVNCFNGEEFLHECLDSIVNQTFIDWELIFWDNCSTDNSANIFFSFNETRFKYFLAPSFTSLADARFLAIKQCISPWIGFIDCDDIWMPNKLDQQILAINLSELSNVGLVYGQSQYFGSSLQSKIPFRNDDNFLYPPLGLQLSCYTKPFILSYMNIVGFSSALFRKDLLQDLNSVVECDLLPDYFWNLHLFATTNVIFLPFPICAIRVHGSNLSIQKRLRCSFNHYKLYVLPQKNIPLSTLIIQHSTSSVLQRLFAAQIPLSFNTFKATLHFHLSYFHLSILLSHLYN